MTHQATYSIQLPADLLDAFSAAAAKTGTPVCEIHLRLMRDWIDGQTASHPSQSNFVMQAVSSRLSDSVALSHDIGVSINVIGGALKLLAESPLTAEQHTLVETAASSLSVMRDMRTATLGAVGAGACGPLTLHREFDVRAELNDLARCMAVLAREKTTELDIVVARSVPRLVRADVMALRRTLENLIGNALKFCEGGSISVRAALATQEPFALSFVVRDNGIGMSQTQMERIFLPFTQADSTIQDKFGGNGVGLTLCKEIIDNLGGKIEVTSSLGQGTTFIVTFPCDTVTTDDPVLRKANVLVIENNHTSRTVLDGLLSMRGYAVVVTSNAEEAIAVADRVPFDLLVIDTVTTLPEKDKLLGTIDAINAKRGQRCRVTIMVADTKEQSVLGAVDERVDAVVGKPISSDGFNTINTLLLPWSHSDEHNLTNPEPARQLDVLAPGTLPKLRQLMGDDLGHSMAYAFEDMPAHLQALRLAIECGDGGQIKRSAHAIGGTAELFGARRLRSLASAIERFGIDQQLSSVAEFLPALMDAFDSTIAALTAAQALYGYGKPLANGRKGLHVLIADDDQPTRAMLKKILENFGFRVSDARDGFDALIKCKKEKPDLVMMDAVMPAMDGFNACSRIRQLNTPVVLSTALCDDESLRKINDAGAALYLPKPVDWERLPYQLLEVIGHDLLAAPVQPSDAT